MAGFERRGALKLLAGGAAVAALPACATSDNAAIDAGPAPGVLRTPDAQFDGLEGYRFAPHYRSVSHPSLGALRMHHLDEGARGGQRIVMLHGQPSWSYVYRKTIPVLTAAGHRVLAPDMIGYGRSDKPARREDYSYGLHLQTLLAFLQGVGGDITLVVHDWGGLLGLRLAAENPQLFKRLVVLDTSLNDGTDPETPAFKAGFDRWLEILATAPELQFSAVIEAQTETTLTPGAVRGYDAPFPAMSFQAGARVMSSFIPRTPDMAQARENGAARQMLRQWQTPVLIAFSEGSQRTHPGQRQLFSSLFPAERIWRNETIGGARHFVTEDKGEEVGALIAAFIAAT